MPALSTAAAPARTPSPYRFFLEAVLWASYVVFGLSWIGYAPFLRDFQQGFALSYAQGSLLISVVSFSKIFMPFATGWIAVRVGIRHALTLGMFFICASLCTPLATTFAGVLASRFVFGLGGAMVVTLIGPAIMEWFPRSELPLINGFNYVAVNVGITASLFITLPLSARYGQRNTLLGYAAVSLAVALLWAFTGRSHPSTGVAQKTSAESYGTVLRSRETWLLAFAFAGPLALYLAFNTWLPSFFAQAHGMGRAESSRLTGLFNTAGIPAAILGGVITKLTGRRKPFIWGPGLLMGASAFGLFLLHPGPALTLCAICFGTALFLWISPLTTLAMELPGMSPKRLSMVMGVFYSVSYTAAFFAPVIVGALRDRTGSFVPGFSIFAAGSFSLAIFGALLPNTANPTSRE